MSKSESFVTHLRSLAERDRGALAVLRRALAFPPGRFPGAFPFVEPFTTGESAWSREAYYLAATLFALHPHHTDDSRASLGRVLSTLVARRGSASLETRFVALLDADEDQLAERLRYAMSLLASEDIPVNYARLLDDLRFWRGDERRVQIRWAQDFYRDLRIETDDATTADAGSGAATE
jgi:CRISPR system Cascade subunit CasB